MQTPYANVSEIGYSIRVARKLTNMTSSARDINEIQIKKLSSHDFHYLVSSPTLNNEIFCVT